MEVTLLGSGDAIGIPAPMCDCDYCLKSEKRRRSGLLIESDGTSIVLDINPDIKEQLHHENIYDVDAFLVTHFHYDHFWGIQELNHIALKDEDHVFNPEDFNYGKSHNRELRIIGNQVTKEHWEKVHHFGRVKESGNVKYEEIEKGEQIKIGDLDVSAFGIDHGPEGTTQGYVIEKDDKKVVYAPDSWKLEESDFYNDADIFFAEGQLFKVEGHANQEVLENQLEKARPERIVLLSVSEHLEQIHTEELKKIAEEKGYEIWSDFKSVKL